METYSRQIGLKIRAYDLRHEYAVMSLRNGQNAFTLSRSMGHTSMETTEKYLALADSDLKEQHDRTSPLKNPWSEQDESRPARRIRALG